MNDEQKKPSQDIQSIKLHWWESSERGPIVVAWLELIGVWMAAIVASRIPRGKQSNSHILADIINLLVLVSIAQFITGIIHLVLHPHTPLKKRFLICLALFFSMVVVLAAEQGTVIRIG